MGKNDVYMRVEANPVNEQQVRTHKGEVTKEMVYEVLPLNMQKQLSEHALNAIADCMNATDIAQEYYDNFVSYKNVFVDGNISLDVYLKAVKFCTYAMLGVDKVTAYGYVFPERMARMLEEEKSTEHIQSMAYAYGRTKTVVAIQKQAVIPVWILNQDKVQVAINVLMELALGADSEKVRCDAATSLVVQLKQPEALQVQMNVGVKVDDSIATVRAAMQELAQAQAKAIAEGTFSAKEIAAIPIANGSTVEVEI